MFCRYAELWFTMIVNRSDIDGNYVVALLTAKNDPKNTSRILCHKDSLHILKLAEDPISVNDIIIRFGYSRTTIYRRILNLLDTSIY